MFQKTLLRKFCRLPLCAECLSPSSSVCLDPNLPWGGFWRYGLWEVIGFEGGHEDRDPVLRWVSSGRQREQGALSMHIRGKDHVRTSPGRGSSPGTPPCWHLEVRHAALTTMRNQCLLFHSPSLWYLLQQPELTKTAAQNGEKIFASHISVKGLVFRIG